MVDLHSHFLYSVDDGAKTFDTSLEMLIQAESVGITKLFRYRRQPVIVEK